MMFRLNQTRKLLSLNQVRSLGNRHKSDLQWSYVTGANPPSPLDNSTIGQVIHKAVNTFEDREAVVSVHQGIRKTYAQLYEDANKLASAFSNIGLKQGDMVGIWAPNCYEWILTQCAASLAGCVLVNINPTYQKEELQYVLNKIPMKGLIAPGSYKVQRFYDLICDLAPELKSSKPGELKSESAPHLKSVMIIPDDTRTTYPGTFCFQSLLESGGTREDISYVKELVNVIQADDLNNIQFTSGTTGSPKGVMLSHFSVLNNARLVCNRLGLDVVPHIISLWVPFFHTFGCVGGSLSCLVYGNKLVLPSAGFDAQACVNSIANEKCTFLFGAPTMYLAVLAAQKKLQLDVSSVQKGLSGGALFASEAISDLKKHLNTKTLYNVYGATETSPATFCSLSDDQIDLKANTIGPPFAHVEAKVVDTAGRVVPVNTVGELYVRTPELMLGYFDDEKATKKAIGPDRYYHSGDLAIITEKGYGRIIGRLDDMINRGGENVYPKETEDVLSRHPNVLENYIVGVPDDKMGEELCVWIHLEEGFSEFDVKGYLKGKVAHYKIPKYIMFVKEFPKTLSGKVKKFEMKARSIEMLGLKSK